MKLYSLPLSPFAARVRGAIYAKGLTVEIVAPPEDWRTSPTYRALNPLGRVPVLVLDDGSSLPESGVIVEYLEDLQPEPALRPRAATALARARLINQVAELYVMPAMLPLFYLFDAAQRDPAAIETQLGKLHEALGWLDGMLEARAYAVDDRLTIADVWLTPARFTIDGLMGFSGRTDLLDRHKAVAAYRERAQGDAVLGRVWEEMADGLRAFAAARAR